MNKFIICCLSLLFLINCKNKIKVEVEKQYLGYDSLYSKKGLFNVKLFTTLKFENVNNKKIILNRDYYKKFYIIFRNDTIILIPNKISNNFVIQPNKSVEIDFVSDLLHQEKNYYNISIEKEISTCPIKNLDNSIMIQKSKNYEIKSLISIIPPNPDVPPYE